MELVCGELDIVAEDVDDWQLVSPASPAADLVARLGEDALLHVECQGYRDPGFVDRLVRYHMTLALRYPARRVHTLALWVIRPPQHQRLQLCDAIVQRLQETRASKRQFEIAAVLATTTGGTMRAPLVHPGVHRRLRRGDARRLIRS